MYDVYARNFRSHATRIPCDEACKLGRICRLNYTSYDKTYACEINGVATDDIIVTTSEPVGDDDNGSEGVPQGALLMSLLFVVISNLMQ